MTDTHGAKHRSVLGTQSVPPRENRRFSEVVGGGGLGNAKRSLRRESGGFTRTPLYTWEQVQKHATADSLWIVIHNKVYDVTQFQTSHPGSAMPFLHYAGKDATAGFGKITKHAANEDIDQYMAGMCIGTVNCL